MVARIKNPNLIKVNVKVVVACATRKKLKLFISDKNAGIKMVPVLLAKPKKEKRNNVTKTMLNPVENHELINEFLMFWTLRSFHFELRNTLPNLSKVDLNLLLRSNRRRK